MTKKVMSSIAGNAKTTPVRQMIGFQEPKMQNALDDWDRLAGTDLQEGLDEIEKYVELVQKDQRSIQDPVFKSREKNCDD